MELSRSFRDYYREMYNFLVIVERNITVLTISQCGSPKNPLGGK
jgi:hypothetical protein